MLPPPDIGESYVDEKTGKATTSFYNWIKSLFGDYTHNITNNTAFSSPTTVALLPPAGIVGRRHFVSDASGPANFGTIASGGGSAPHPVYDDGTNWRFG